MKKYFGLGLLMGVSLVACTSFSYERWGWDYKNQKLLHWKTAEKDLPAEVCDNGDGKFKCVVLFSSDFYELKANYEAIEAALKICEKK